MLSAVLQALFAFVLTGVIGSWIAHAWQARAARESRFFDASKVMYQQMVDSADSLSALAGRRLYASQRICLVAPGSEDFESTVAQYRAVVIEWNEKLLALELSVRTKFRTAYLSDFERLQGDFATVGSHISDRLSGNSSVEPREVLRKIRILRSEFFTFTQNMMKEAQLLHRQMHFGVRINYDREGIRKMSTQDLIKLLFTSRIEGQAVVRSPTDFGLPVGISDARFGIYE